MFKNILMPAMIGATVALTGTAFADSKTNVHKEAQTKTNEAVTDKSANPNAAMDKKVYKESQKGAGKATKDKMVNPDAKMNKKLYKESQKSAVPSEMEKKSN